MPHIPQLLRRRYRYRRHWTRQPPIMEEIRDGFTRRCERT